MPVDHAIILTMFAPFTPFTPFATVRIFAIRGQFSAIISSQREI